MAKQVTQAKFGTDGKTTLVPARSEADFAESKMRTGLLTPLAVGAGERVVRRSLLDKSPPEGKKDEMVAFLDSEIRKAKKAKDIELETELREDREVTILGNLDEDGNRDGGIVPATWASSIEDLRRQADDIEFRKQQVTKSSRILDDLIDKGAVHRSGPNRGEVNVPRLVNVAQRGTVDEIADSIIAESPSEIPLVSITKHDKVELKQDEALLRALERRFRERNQTFSKSQNAKQLRAEADEIEHKFVHGTAKDFETSERSEDQPVDPGNAQLRFDNLPQKTKDIDLAIQAERVAPRVPKDIKDTRLQRLWLKDPTQLDFEGVDERQVGLLGTQKPHGFTRKRKSILFT